MNQSLTKKKLIIKINLNSEQLNHSVSFYNIFYIKVK